jgi:predicted RecB family nuclease
MTGFIYLNMKLVRIVNYKLEIEEELLLLKPFKEVYKSDKSKDKIKFFDFLTIVYYTYDPRSDYNYITNEEERLKEVCISNGLDVPKFTAKETECIELYKQLTTTISSALLKSTRVAIGKVQEFLENLNMYATDDKGKPLYGINTVTSAIKQIPALVKEVMEAEKMVAKEIEESGRARGGNNKKLFEDGFTL